MTIPLYSNIKYEDGEWWYYGNKDGNRRRLSSHIRKNKKRMFIGGKYVKTNSPLHKPGRYNNLTDVAFDKLSDNKVINTSVGFIYCITNKAWKNWIKIGTSIDAEDRLRAFNVGAPFRDYKLEFKIKTTDRHQIENDLHKELRKSFKCKGEWFQADKQIARRIINTHMKKHKGRNKSA